MVTTLEYLGRRTETEQVYAELSEPAQAVLRQFSLERLIGYGVAYADAIEVRAAVIDGADWQAAATRLAMTVLAQARSATASVPTQIAALRRASALLRMAQIMMSADTDERRALYTQAAALFGEAATLAGDGTAMLIDTPSGPLAGWMYAATTRSIGSAIVIGGVEGWAMDFASQGEALAARGVDTLMLDGPGQGESRLVHGHYFGSGWIEAYRGAIDFMEQRSPAHEIAFVGNSLGGSLALTLAAIDPRIRVCCSNGGIVQPTPAPGADNTGAGQPPRGGGKSLFLAKMLLASGTDDPDVARIAWSSIDPLKTGRGTDLSLLILHGGKDMAVPYVAAETLLAQASATRKEMIVFSDGDHCLYNHRDDRDALMADWVCADIADRNARPTP